MAGQEQCLLNSKEDEGRDGAIENFESAIFAFENRESGPAGKLVLISVDSPGPYAAVKELIGTLMKEPRCRGISMLVYGVARNMFEADYGEVFRKKSSGANVTSDLANENPDIVLNTVTAHTDPAISELLARSKSTMGSSKSFLLFEAWGGPGTTVRGHEEDAAELDGVLCADQLGKKLAERALPAIPPERVQVTGTPVLEEMYVEHSEEFVETVRKKIGIESDEIAILYLGDTTKDYESDSLYETDEDLNIKTLLKTLTAITTAAMAEPGRRFVVMVRPHPRDQDKRRFIQAALAFTLPKNVSLRIVQNPSRLNAVVSATEHNDSRFTTATINELRYAADAVMSIVGTENFLAPRLGRRAVFLGYGESGMGGAVIERVYGKELVAEIQTAEPLITFAKTEEGVWRAVLDFKRAPSLIKHPDSATSATERMVNVIFDD